MQPERHVRLFRNGRNQAVRIPRDFEIKVRGFEAGGEDFISKPFQEHEFLARCLS